MCFDPLWPSFEKPKKTIGNLDWNHPLLSLIMAHILGKNLRQTMQLMLIAWGTKRLVASILNNP